MTFEMRATVELKDLIAVEYECRECGAKSVRRIEGSAGARMNVVPMQCGNCNAIWMDAKASRDHVAQLLNLIALLADQGGARFTLRLEVAGLPPQPVIPRSA